MRESLIETRLRERVEDYGGLCYKWVSPGNPGVPDRIVFFPGVAFLVELKSDVGKLHAAQKIQKKRLEKLKIEVRVLKSYFEVEMFIKDLKERQII